MKKKYIVLEDLYNQMRFITRNKLLPNTKPIAVTNYHSYAKKVCEKGKQFDFNEMIANMRRNKIFAQ